MGDQLYLERFVWFDHEARKERYPNAGFASAAGAGAGTTGATAGAAAGVGSAAKATAEKESATMAATSVESTFFIWNSFGLSMN